MIYPLFSLVRTAHVLTGSPFQTSLSLSSLTQNQIHLKGANPFVIHFLMTGNDAAKRGLGGSGLFFILLLRDIET